MTLDTFLRGRVLSETLKRDTRLQKLSFTVQRSVDVDAWAAQGDHLFDLRKRPFGEASLAELAVRGSRQRGAHRVRAKGAPTSNGP